MNDFHRYDLIEKERGGVLILVPISLFLAIALVAATLVTSTANVNDSQRESRKIMAYYVAKAGVERQVYDFKKLTKTAVLVDPFSGIERFHNMKTYSGCLKMSSAQAPPNQAPLTDPDGDPVDARADLVANGVSLPGTFDVSIRVEGYDPANPGVMSSSRRFVTIRSTGWVPSQGAPNAVSHTVESTVLVELSSSEVFDYAYFINNWGWLYGHSIDVNGNARSNGQFDSGGYRVGAYGTPRYLGANGSDIYGYIDDNEDGLKDGTDGGIYSSWDIIGCQNAEGMGGKTVDGEYVNQHDYEEQIEMPNLTDLALYEKHALDNGASVSIGGSQVSDGVYGDDPGETGNLVLIGTPTNPIELNGTLVVRENLIIKGTVTGQGVIYAGGNVYIADDITYKNPPSTVRPSGSSEAEFETWLSANQTADALGLFAREHVVMGDYTNSYWQSYVKGWMNSSSNKSREDAGEDGIPNTKNGLDGIYGTADDDVLEDDGKWTTEEYSVLDALLGNIPAGSNVGDPIPGTGEDIDGDGKYDDTVAMSEFNLPYALASGVWGGNLPAGITDFNQIATRNIANFDAALYTNHALAGYIRNPGGDINFNGCIVSRNESIIYSANNLRMNHDARLIGGGDNFGYFLPRTFKSIRFMKSWDSVPNIHWDDPASQGVQGTTGGY